MMALLICHSLLQQFCLSLCNILKSVIFQLCRNAMILHMHYVFMLFAHACDDGATA